ncbi:MAG: EF-P lysine aminoacylase GenX [Calditrichaeota bacterium]|nr:EF-P lysine aminoacylase GenX [Calditrichota bacterium]
MAGRLVQWKLLPAGCFSGALRDATGTLTFQTGDGTQFYPTATPFRRGDVVEVLFDSFAKESPAKELRRLVPTQVEWASLQNETTNWKRAVVSEEQKALLEARSRLIQTIRTFFLEREFLEIDAPALVRFPGQEPHLEPFETRYRSQHGGQPLPLYLQTSPEFSMKKLLAAGFEKIFYLGHSFRNEPVSTLHQPEFLMLEWYRAYADYTALMTDCEVLLRTLAESLYKSGRFSFQKEPLNFSPPFQRLSLREALQQYAGIDYMSVQTSEAFARVARKKGYTGVEPNWGWDDIFFEIFLNEIEPRLGKPVPTFLTEYPASMGALARRKEADPDFVERFELYVAGIELANAFTELNDPEEQKSRFLEDQAARRKAGKTPFPIDAEFLEALRIGMPPAAGIALGVDRLVMVLLNQPSIQQITLFPETF